MTGRGSSSSLIGEGGEARGRRHVRLGASPRVGFGDQGAGVCLQPVRYRRVLVAELKVYLGPARYDALDPGVEGDVTDGPHAPLTGGHCVGTGRRNRITIRLGWAVSQPMHSRAAQPERGMRLPTFIAFTAASKPEAVCVDRAHAEVIADPLRAAARAALDELATKSGPAEFRRT